MRRKLHAGAAGFALLLAGAVPAMGNEYAFDLTSARPAAPTGLSIRVLYRDPRSAEAKPPPLEHLHFDLPHGMRVDTAAVARCDASDVELRLAGAAACPPGSRVGSGTLVAETGFPATDPVVTDITVFNGDRELIEVVSFRDTGVTAGIDRLELVDGDFVAHPPTVPGGPPDGRTTVREVAVRVPTRFGIDGRPYITTPPACPDAGEWPSTLTTKFATYAQPVVSRDATPCDAVRAARPRLRVTVRPRRVRPGRRTRVRVRVRSSSPSCRRGVRIRIGRRRARTNDRGRARLALRFARPGRRVVHTRRRGCRSDRTFVRARAPRR